MKTSYFVGVLLEASRTTSPHKSTTNSIQFAKRGGKVYYTVGNPNNMQNGIGVKELHVTPSLLAAELQEAMRVMKSRGIATPAVSMVSLKTGKDKYKAR